MKLKIYASHELEIEYDLDPSEYNIDTDKAEQEINENIPDVTDPEIVNECKEINQELESVFLDDIKNCYIEGEYFKIEFTVETQNNYDEKELVYLADELILMLWDKIDGISVLTSAEGSYSKPNWNPLSNYGYYETEEDFETDDCEVNYDILYINRKTKINKIEEVK